MTRCSAIQGAEQKSIFAHWPAANRRVEKIHIRRIVLHTLIKYVSEFILWALMHNFSEACIFCKVIFCVGILIVANTHHR